MKIKSGEKVTLKVTNLEMIRKMTRGVIKIEIPRMRFVDSIEYAIIKYVRVCILIDDIKINEHQTRSENRFIIDSIDHKNACRKYCLNNIITIIFSVTNNTDIEIIKGAPEDHLYEFRLEVAFENINNLLIDSKEINECDINMDIISDDSSILSFEPFVTNEKLFDDNMCDIFNHYLKCIEIMSDMIIPKRTWVI